MITRKSNEREYILLMSEAKINMQGSLKKILIEVQYHLPREKLKRLENLCLNRNTANQDYQCFDDLWENIEKIFSSVRDNTDEKQMKTNVDEFKKILNQLLDAGIPFDFDKKLNFWSSQFARQEAETFSKITDGTTDSLTLAYFRKLFLEWPEENLVIFLPMVTAIRPKYPELAIFFWNALSDLYLNAAKRSFGSACVFSRFNNNR